MSTLISCQQMIFRKSQRNNIPWEAEPSIYSVISNKARFGPVENIDLPDDQRFAISERLLWSAGAADGVFTHHVDLKMDEKLAGIAMSHLLEIARLNRISDKVQLYAVLRSNHVISFLDYLLEKLQETDIDLEALHDTAKWLTTETPDREPVKLGIALLGILDLGSSSEDLDIVRLLGLHNEFTLYSAVALTNRLNNPLVEIWKLAKQVHGWGRIHIVEMICNEQVLPAQIQDWLIKEGFRNSVMDEYLACRCAIAGNLKQRFIESEPNQELLDSTGKIIQALLNEGSPSYDVDDYPDSLFLLQKYLELMMHRALTDEHRDVLHCIRKFLVDENGENSKAATESSSGSSQVQVETTSDSIKERVVTAHTFSDGEAAARGWERRYAKEWTPDLRLQLLQVVELMLAKKAQEKEKR